MTDYEEGLQFLENRKNFEKSVSIPYQEMEQNLDELRKFLEFLHLPSPKARLIHIAGTKGKSSTGMILEQILRNRGYRTGLFTSPHLFHLEERFAVNGSPVSPDDLAKTLLDLKEYLNRFEQKEGKKPFTFFELCVPAAFLLFGRKEADFIILETGLGGRIDATNICRPDLSILTSLGYEHQAQLGSTLEEIGAEKGGIIKPGVPVVSGIGTLLSSLPSRAETEHLPPSLRKTCVTREELLKGEARVRQIAEEAGSPWFPVLRVESDTAAAMAHLVGAAQPVNGEIALTALEILAREGKYSGTRKEGLDTLKQLKLPARGEIVWKSPLVVVDGAHTRDSAKRLAESIEKRWASCVPKRLVLATLADKDAEGILWELSPHFDQILIAEISDQPRGLKAKELMKHAEKILSLLPKHKRPQLACFGNLSSQIDEICKSSRRGITVFTGSFYFASEVVQEFNCRKKDIGL